MNANISPFSAPILVTRPLLPDLDTFSAGLREVWDAQWLTNNGRQHQLLEKRVCERLKVPGLCLFNNATIALITAIQSLRLSGEVITTPFTFAATPHVLTWNGIRPVFCDIDAQYLTLDPAKIEAMITPQTTGILAVHVFGAPCDVVGVQEVADRYGLKVVYDAAHAFDTEIDGVGIGNFGDISAFSFHATKLFHSAEGGALAFRDPHLKKRIDLLKNFGIKNEDEVVMPGINGKMNEIQAALGLLVLDMVTEEQQKRKKVQETYHACLADVPGLSFVPDKPGVKSSYQYCCLRIDEKQFGRSRDYVYAEFKKYNVFTRKYFFPLCSDYSCYRQLPSSAPSNLPVAHQAVQQVLSLPFHGRLELEAVEKICTILKSMRG